MHRRQLALPEGREVLETRVALSATIEARMARQNWVRFCKRPVAAYTAFRYQIRRVNRSEVGPILGRVAGLRLTAMFCDMPLERQSRLF